MFSKLYFFALFSIFAKICGCTKLYTGHSRLAEPVVLSVLEEVVLAVVPEEGGGEVGRQPAPLLRDGLGAGWGGGREDKTGE